MVRSISKLKIDLERFELDYDRKSIILDFSKKEGHSGNNQKKYFTSRNQKDRNFQLIVIAIVAKLMEKKKNDNPISWESIWENGAKHFNNEQWRNRPYGKKDITDSKRCFCNGLYIVWTSRLKDPYLELCPYLYSKKSQIDLSEIAMNQLKTLFSVSFNREIKGTPQQRALYKLGLSWRDIEIHDPLRILNSVSEKSDEKSAETLFTENDNEYIQFFKKTEDLDYKRLTDFSDGFGIQEPANGFFKNLYSVPIKEQEDLKKLIKENKNILITGKSKVGKTRLVFDVLRKQKKCYVLALKYSAFRNVDSLKISDYFNQKREKLIWFIDDIDYYQSTSLQDPIWEIYEKLHNVNKNTIVIATLRSDETKPKSRLLEHRFIEPLEFRDEIENIEADNFMNHYYKGEQLPSHYAKTFWSIMFDIEYMKDIYNNSSKMDENSRSIMKTLKLLQKILPSVEYTLLKLTFENVYHSFKGTIVFDKGIRKLEKLNFLKIDKTKNAVSSQEPYLEKIVYYPDMDLDMEKLINILANNSKFLELSHLDNYYYHRKHFDNCVKCNQLIAHSSSSNKLKSTAYYNWGISLFHKAELQDSKEEQKKYYNNVCEKYKTAIDYKKYYAEAYCNWGNALFHIAKLQDSKEEQKEHYNNACEKYEKAVDCKKNCGETYYNWGISLFHIGLLQESKEEQKKYCNNACEKYEKAVDCKEDFAEAYSNWGVALLHISSLQDSKEERKKYCNNACEKYEKIVDCKKDSAGIYYNWGITLFEIAKLQGSKKKKDKYYKKSFEKFWKSYLLLILQNEWDLTYLPRHTFENMSKGIDNSIYPQIIPILEFARNFILKGINKESIKLSKKEIEFLKKRKGKSSESDIVIKALLEDKKPDVTEIPDDNLLLKATIHLAKKIIETKKQQPNQS